MSGGGSGGLAVVIYGYVPLTFALVVTDALDAFQSPEDRAARAALREKSARFRAEDAAWRAAHPVVLPARPPDCTAPHIFGPWQTSPIGPVFRSCQLCWASEER